MSKMSQQKRLPACLVTRSIRLSPPRVALKSLPLQRCGVQSERSFHFSPFFISFSFSVRVFLSSFFIFDYFLLFLIFSFFHYFVECRVVRALCAVLSLD